MNPISNWQDLRDGEKMCGGNPRYCIMGTDDFTEMCGAIGAIHHSDKAIGIDGKFSFEGVLVMESRSKKRGILFV